MTDSEIINALEHCAGPGCEGGGCPLWTYENCTQTLSANVLNLVLNQKSEIDRLKNELHGKVDYIHEQREIIDALKDSYNKKKIT
ncbi:MAG: hypothetical protein ACI4KR_09280, partial [Ruminiclostridium sp.]